MTRERLQSFSLQDLKRIALQEGLEVVEGLDRGALLEMILEAFADSRREREQESSLPILGEERKYELTQEEELAAEPAGLEDLPIPPRYNETRLVPLVRDPHWAFAYWDIEETRARAVRKTPRFESLLLRVRTEGDILFDNANPWFDIPIQFSDSGWYIYLPYPGCTYTLELGFAAGGKYHLLCRSQPIRTPREAAEEGRSRTDRHVGPVVEEAEGEDPIERSMRLSLDPAGSESAIPQRITSLPMEEIEETEETEERDESAGTGEATEAAGTKKAGKAGRTARTPKNGREA